MLFSFYKFLCSDCNAAYYGETTRNRWVCCNEHLGVSKNSYMLAAANPSSIRDHVQQVGHTASTEDFCKVNLTDNYPNYNSYTSLSN